MMNGTLISLMILILILIVGIGVINIITRLDRIIELLSRNESKKKEVKDE